MEGFIVKLEIMKVYQCEKCPYIVFTNRQHLEAHQKRHDPLMKYPEKLREHMLSAKVMVKRVRIYKCTKCSINFLAHMSLYKHQLKEHPRLKSRYRVKKQQLT